MRHPVRRHRVSFDEACAAASAQFEALRQSAGSSQLFERAVEFMRAERWCCDLRTGTTYNRDGWQARFLDYDWSARYFENPSEVFFDFFRGPLANQYSRLQRGLEN